MKKEIEKKEVDIEKKNSSKIYKIIIFFLILIIVFLIAYINGRNIYKTTGLTPNDIDNYGIYKESSNVIVNNSAINQKKQEKTSEEKSKIDATNK